mmetsp:Transcript_5466/g.7101  ORF Transcript_5466/g.7101 Transcript_5466/m.7101 type:complete len:572 (+) Transcript_5466:90-1805(+)
MLSRRQLIHVVQRSRFATKPPIPSADKSVKAATRNETATAISSSEAGGGGGGVNPFFIMSSGILVFIGAVAYDPQIARENLNKMGLIPILEPFVSNIEKIRLKAQQEEIIKPKQPTTTTAPKQKEENKVLIQKETNINKDNIEEKKEKSKFTDKVVEKKEDVKEDIKEVSIKSEQVLKKTENKTEMKQEQLSKKEEKEEKQKESQNIQNNNQYVNRKEDKKEESVLTEEKTLTNNSQVIPKLTSKKVTSPSIGSILVDDLLGDLENLNREELLYRLNNLTNDMKEHAKWEALRQHDVWRRAEMATWNKYSELISEQRDDLIMQNETKLLKMSDELEKDLKQALNNKELQIAQEDAKTLKEETERIEEYFKNILQAKEDELVAEFAEKKAARQVAITEERLQSAETRLQSFDVLSEKMSSLKSSFEHQDKIKNEALDAHRSSAHVLLGYSKQAAPLVPQLQQDFKSVFAAGVKASMIPRGLEDSGFGQLVGSVLGTVLLFAPEISPTSGVDGSTRMFITARNAVESGDLKTAIQALDELQGPARLTVYDWIADAKLRVDTDDALVNLAHFTK